MKKLLALMLVFLMIFAVGCLTDNDDDDKDDGGTADNGGGSGTVTATDYFPLKIGATWNYHETGSDYGESYTNDFSMTVAGTMDKNGKTYFVIIEEGDSTFVRVENNIVYMMDFMEDFVDDTVEKAAGIPAAAKASIAEQIAAEDAPWFNFNIGTGKTWTVYSQSFSGEGYSTSYSMTGKNAGRENVTVPAGTFTNCLKVEMVTTSKSTWSYNGQTGSETWTDTTTIWFASGVGVVKSSDKETSTGETGYSSTTTLTSYSIPK